MTRIDNPWSTEREQSDPADACGRLRRIGADRARAEERAMTVHVALLRAVNVGGRNRVAMADLRDLLAALGFADGRSLLQSGNLVFRGDGRSGAELERLLEAETAARLALRTDYLVRTAAEWKRIVARNPFPDEAARDPGQLVVMALKDAPGTGDVAALQAAIRGPGRVRVDGTQAYVVYPSGIGRSKLTTGLIEATLGTRGTGRNWTTVRKLADLVGA
jgi:uncharacterized protein (DUF1697 family)